MRSCVLIAILQQSYLDTLEVFVRRRRDILDLVVLLADLEVCWEGQEDNLHCLWLMVVGLHFDRSPKKEKFVYSF